ncbi:MAG: iron-sulfur cluster assembly protein [Bacteroidales bacterium]|nr:iron-sulfur cluster assembly protein [Bacteroidales bacterium]
MITLSDVANAIKDVKHPAINYSLGELGIVTDVELENNSVSLVFAFPFPEIPIADQLINSIVQPLNELGLEVDYSIRVMTDEERNVFLQMEQEAWKGM